MVLLKLETKTKIKGSKELSINDKIFNITENYRPDLILLGHNNILNSKTLMKDILIEMFYMT